MKKIIKFFTRIIIRRKIKKGEEQEIISKICRKIKESDELS